MGFGDVPPLGYSALAGTCGEGDGGHTAFQSRAHHVDKGSAEAGIGREFLDTVADLREAGAEGHALQIADDHFAFARPALDNGYGGGVLPFSEIDTDGDAPACKGRGPAGEWVTERPHFAIVVESGVD